MTSAPNGRNPVGRRRFRLAALAVVGMVVAAAGVTPAEAARPGEIRYESSSLAVPGSYIVLLKQGALRGRHPSSVIDRLARGHRAAVQQRYVHGVSGFAAEMTRAQAFRLSRDPAVALVEQNRVVRAAGSQLDPPWGLDRIDQRRLRLNLRYDYPSGGEGVKAYVIDSGIRTTHSAFGGRATWGTNTTGDGWDLDCDGHGTHVAGTIGGVPYGVAKAVSLVAVKVLDCEGSGTVAGVVAGLDWVTEQHQPGEPAVANLSLGAQGSDDLLEGAVRAAIADGVVVSVAAGNQYEDACLFTPARVPEALTVSATTPSDSRPSFANYGGCVDLFAPGTDILSAWNLSDTDSETISGTSMATPHVTGAAALVLAAHPADTPADVAARLIAGASRPTIGNAAGSPQRLLYTGTGTDCPPAGNTRNVRIPDPGSATSSIRLSGCQRRAATRTVVKVSIVHSQRGDLVVYLIAPDGRVRRLFNRSGGAANDLKKTFIVNMSASPANGVWKLKVKDKANRHKGYINSWRLDA